MLHQALPPFHLVPLNPRAGTATTTKFILKRPKLSLKFSRKASDASQSGTQTPQSAVQTPSGNRLKLKLGGTSVSLKNASATIDSPVLSDHDSTTSYKKRKRLSEGVVPNPTSAITNGYNTSQPSILKLNTSLNARPSATPSIKIKMGGKPANTPAVKLKMKGRIPKRPLGVGYDSELEEREVDPVILEAFVLRMQPGEDCEYVRNAVISGTIGTSVLHGGPSISLRFFDTNGRRGVLRVRSHDYAVSLVDLPTITEGMKSWDKKNFMKSVDISQMCLVLGRVSSDEEAKTYPLPPDVNPRNYQYAHGLTAPMKWVRKRRFDRTARAKVADIETAERKLDQLLAADHAAGENVKWEITNTDPRLQDESESQSSEVEDEEDEEDAMGEDEPVDDDYFGHTEPDTAQYDESELAEFEAMFDEPSSTTLPNEAGTSAATSNAPAGMVDTPGESSNMEVDDADDDDDDEEGPEDNAEDVAGPDDEDEEEEEATNEKQEAMLKIKEKQAAITKYQASMKRVTSLILKKKDLSKIRELENDIEMLRRKHGLIEGGNREAGEGTESEEE